MTMPAPIAPLVLGNGAIARGLLEAGCEVVTAYPGTPATEIMEETIRQKTALGLDTFTEWSVNEKVAFDVALAASLCGKRAATAMKQVGLNVASDSLLSAAYTGVVGGFVVVSCDDPGPHSSQTEQDSRLFAHFAKVPVLDPSSPREARDMVQVAFELSERHRIPVMIRPTTRVCHARQIVRPGPIANLGRKARFDKDTKRWAATPRFRLELHRELNAKLEAIRAEFEASPLCSEEPGDGPLGIIASGMAWATVRDLLAEEGLHVPVLKIGTPFPLPLGRVMAFIARHERVLVIEEPDTAIETQIPDRRKVLGRLTGHVPPQGELLPATVGKIITGREFPALPVSPGPPPRLCPGCGHRAAFFAMRRALSRAIFTGDIGCYTLGINQKALDTCLDMGASITLANGFWHAHKRDGRDVPIVAVIGDSTFFHAGLPSLLNTVIGGARIIVVVLDNGTVAMTGFQPTPADSGADIAAIARGIGVRFVETIDPYEVEDMVALLKRAHAFTRQVDGGVAMVVARRPCALLQPPAKVPVEIDETLCNGCEYCLDRCECPALQMGPSGEKVELDYDACVDCGACVSMCPLKAIVPRQASVGT